MIARFAPTELRVDTSALSAGDRKALKAAEQIRARSTTCLLKQSDSGAKSYGSATVMKKVAASATDRTIR